MVKKKAELCIPYKSCFSYFNPLSKLFVFERVPSHTVGVRGDDKDLVFKHLLARRRGLAPII